MSAFGIFAVLITATALLSYINERFLRLPSTIGVMASALVVSMALFGLGQLGLHVDDWAEGILLELDFDEVLMKGMLSFLLFAGALHIQLDDLLARRWTIISLATVGVLLSTVLIGSAAWALFGMFGLDMPYVWALAFGALITPTDPIAVMGLLKTANTPKALESMIAGESLFNDGVGVVVFTLVLGSLTGGHEFSMVGALELFVAEAIGGVIYGFGLGYVAFRLLRSIDNYTVEILITLALVAGGYSLAGMLHTSGPIAMVVAGLFIGNHGRSFGMSDETRQYLDPFWEMLDEVLNALLFVLIGFEALVVNPSPRFLAAALLIVPLTLVVRSISVGLPLAVLRIWRPIPPYAVGMLTWCGLRGGISIALALGLPASPHRDLLLVVTYTVVIFSILVQGLTAGRLARWVGARS